jgi:hypothetical protein
VPQTTQPERAFRRHAQPPSRRTRVGSRRTWLRRHDDPRVAAIEHLTRQQISHLRDIKLRDAGATGRDKNGFLAVRLACLRYARSRGASVPRTKAGDERFVAVCTDLVRGCSA